MLSVKGEKESTLNGVKLMKKGPASPSGFFSAQLTSELHSLLMQEFGQNIEDGAKLQEIGLRLVEFVAIKERRKEEEETTPF